MPKGVHKSARKLVTAGSIEPLLQGFQEAAERYGSEAAKQRRRQLLHGIRVGYWVAFGKPSQDEVVALLRAELFGHPLVLMTDEAEACHPGTDDEVESDD